MAMHRRHFLSHAAVLPAAGILLSCARSLENSERPVIKKKPSSPGDDGGNATKGPEGEPAGDTPGFTKETILTRENPGKWAGKEATHVPTFAFTGGKLVITTAHVMEAAHFISSHQIRTTQGRLVGEKLFKFGIDANNPASAHTVDFDLFPNFHVYSRCNLHGLWRTTGALMDLEDGAKDRVLYTMDKPGKWAGKEATHVATVEVKGETFVVLTPHAITAEHFISKHQVRSETGELLAENLFDPSKAAANVTSEFPLQVLGAHAKVHVYSLCNLHGVWMTEFEVPKA